MLQKISKRSSLSNSETTPSVVKDSSHHPLTPAFAESILSSLGDEVMVVDAQGRIVYCNEMTLQNLGFSKRYLYTKYYGELLHPVLSAQQWQVQRLQMVKSAKQPVTYQEERLTKGKRLQKVEVSAVCITYAQQDYLMLVIRDITRYLKEYQDLQDKVEFYHLLCDGAGDPLVILDLNGDILYANSMAGQYLNIPAKNLVGKNFRRFLHRSSIPKAVEFFSKACRDPEQFRVELEAVNHHKEIIPVEVTVSPIFDNKTVVAIHASVRDIRERREFELLVRESEKLEAVQLFMTGTAQELRNPLLALMRQSDALINRYKDRDFEYIGYKEFKDIFSNIQNINQQLKYCYDTANRLIHLKKKKIGLNGKRCSANAIIREVLRLKAYHLRDSNIKTKLKLSEKLPELTVDSDDFNQIINNIVNNAAQAMPGGGTLSINTHYLHERGYAQIDIRDDGIGIPREDLKHVFDPFFTTKQRGMEKNLGLGLPIAYSLIKGYQGEIKVESSLRQGTCVRIYLPVVKAVHGHE
jgi:PAS domain S-box-containing protein